jgi:uncharacterized protein
MRQDMKKGVTWYLILAFLGAWIPWGIAMRLDVGSWFPLAALPGGFSPAISAFVVRKWITREGFTDAGLRLNLRKWPYYLVAVLLPFIVMAFVALEARALSVATPDFSAHAITGTIGAKLHVASMARWLTWGSISLLLIVGSIVSAPLVWGEEFGWRGYLQVRLFARRPLWAAIATGLIWAVWHYPLIFRGYEYPKHTLDGVAVFTVCAVLISIILGWLRSATGSVWTPSLAHAAIDTVGGALGLLLFGNETSVVVGYTGLLALVPLGILSAWICWGGRLGTVDKATTA